MKDNSAWPLLDNHGLQQIPLRFYGLLLLLLRPYICWVAELSMMRSQQSLLSQFYPRQHDFMLACLIALPLLLMVAALSQRRPKGQRFWFYLWRPGMWLLWLVTLADMVHSISGLDADVILDAPWRLLAPLLLLLAIIWLLLGKTLPVIFKEWPEPEPAKANKRA
ncbi:hypothetical protein VT06_10080 [Arsukibacterium sp. MJ3]|uniref:DUF2919 family protein n=1 Tax=Arsukibacterium sp. MJ3 TaxID=1632859 RepID=UPI000627145D|nr:DUF2919 family protein [Arsukibacterium sp. MJ3]KKO48847.1 hypothetical protein VT06_10080 [Arsukibacterium sp. MJ3]